MLPIAFTVNDRPCQTTCAPGGSLLQLLRAQGWAGVHRVCESGDCGGCTVWVEGQPVHSCIFPAVRAADKAITTVEGLAASGDLSQMQQAFLDHQGFQCGFCTPGMILSCTALEADSETAIRAAMDGNMCRCTGYQTIVESVLAAKNACPKKVPLVQLATSGVGQSVPKQDGTAIVTGQPIYTDDWVPSGVLHMQVVRSPHAHARIRAIDTSQAEALPGVHLVLTHRDVPRTAFSTAGHGEPVPDPHDHYLLDPKVRFVGDRVAAVVADSVAIATQACQLISVDYEVLPAVLDPLDAVGDKLPEVWPEARPIPPSPPLIHDEPESYQIAEAAHNISGRVTLSEGDIATGLAAADVVLERVYTLPACQHFHLEPHLCSTWIDEDGVLVVRSSTQVPFYCQNLLCRLFDLPKQKVRVYKPNIGGGFGNKQEMLCEDLCALATLKLGRPVQWCFNRQEEFTATTSRHATQIHLQIGAKRDGTLTAMAMHAVANAGAYGNHSTQVVYLTGCYPLGLYRCPHQRYVGHAVYTNTMPGGAFRGYGATQGTFAVETLLDELAQTLDLDPIELRQRHLITPADEILLGSRSKFHVVGSSGVDEALQRVTQALGPPGARSAASGRQRGVGYAVSMQASGLAKIHSAAVRLTLKPDGRYEMRTGAVDVGTGSDTTLRQIAAEVLKADIAKIDLVTADTHRTPFDGGSYASATLYISGQASRLAAEALRSHLLTLAAPRLQAPADTLFLDGDLIQGPDQALSLAALASDPSLGAISIEREYAADHASLTFAILGVEVEVDTDTGKVQVLRAVHAIDLGKAINPRICEGQAVGGFVMGLGYALSEELVWDESGHILNPSPRTYRIPLAKDVPPVEVHLIETNDPFGPYGAKGLGEIATNCAAPAIANAIAYATGQRLYQLPMNPERVWRALQAPSSPP